MLKKLCSVFMLSFLLVGCTDDNAHEETVDEEVIEKKTVEQYVAEFEATPNYQKRIEGIEVHFLEPVDFEGDEVPEMVLGTDDALTTSNVTVFKLENDQWIQDTALHFESIVHISVEPIGKLTYEDGTLKEAFAFGRREAHATSMSESFSILNYNEDTQTIEEPVSIPLQSTEMYRASLEENKITVIAQNGSTVDYRFKNGEIVDQNGNRLGIIINEELAELVGTNINDYAISLVDSYYVAQSKIKEALLAEEYNEGAICSFYETFFICDYHKENGGMHAYYITPKKEVKVVELTKIFNRTVDIEKWDNEMEGGYSYTAEVMTDSGMYNLQFNGESPDSVLEFIVYVPN